MSCTVFGDDGVEERIDAVPRRCRAEEKRLKKVAWLGDIRGSVRGAQNGRAHLVVGRVDLAPSTPNDWTVAQAVREAGHVIGGLEYAARIAEE
jgi:hypothetical protein